MKLLILTTLTYLATLAAASAQPGRPPQSPIKDGKTCTVHALGNQQDDTPQITKAFEDCNHGGTVVFPETEDYWIGTRLNPVIYDVEVEWRGVWTLSDNLTYWRNNSYPIAFQNHHAGFVITGERIHINGYGTGGIFGNGNAWYDVEQEVTQPGRPMPFVFWNVTEVLVEHFYVKDSPLWTLNIMNGTNLHFDNIICNSTAHNAPYGTNWVQNTDGLDTMDVHNLVLTNFWYRGGDDCVAIKPRSYNIFIQNVTCNGGNGIAIGSLGQYLEDSSVVGVTVRDVKALLFNGYMVDSAYLKTWIGALVPQDNYESGGLPRGGGWGNVSSILFENFLVQGSLIGPAISQDSGDNGSYAGTSKMQISDIIFRNFTGYTQGGTGNRTAEISCSEVFPCFDIILDSVNLASAPDGTAYSAQGTCAFVQPGGVYGITGSGC